MSMRKGRGVQALALAACIGMFLVLLMGATVTQTESGRGCGDDWPLCNGKFVPDYTITSIIEYSHRVVSGAVGLVILAAAVAVFLRVPRRAPRLYAGGALFFTIVQAGLGAAQVKNPQSDEILALHFGISLLAFTLTLLTVTSVREYYRSETFALPARPVSARYRAAVWLTTLYAYLVVYTGAYTSHTDSGGGCAGFPLCNGALVPSALEGATAVAFTHRTAAYLLLAVVLLLALATRRAYAEYRELAGGAAWALVLVTAQVLSGGLLMALMGTGSYVIGTLLHTMIISVLFAVLSYLSIAVWRAGRESRYR
ncbi:COX15/CtaA family protein [Paenibacillus sp.]|uniref:COX15/CtaA family protein n=1 Tax=Paenibacillus sp. TaxID=58172 RepID=UPI002D564696|nr:COX15/CtaA family protein [Paenibacillus sp.]HZG57575.1 COX15/CtaA family protein [Paenibacillus sp.]